MKCKYCKREIRKVYFNGKLEIVEVCKFNGRLYLQSHYCDPEKIVGYPNDRKV